MKSPSIALWHRIAFAAVLIVAAAYRFPGVSWGFDFNTYPYPTAHPDEGIACIEAIEHKIAEVKREGNPQERGMLFQCAVLGFVFEPDGATARTRVGRIYSVFWGLLTVALTGLIARKLRGEVAGIFAALLLATSGINLITSFWARGQVNNVAFCLASMLTVLHIREAKGRAVMLIFVASLFAGLAISTRWSVALIPMLIGCAVARRPVMWKLGAGAAGGMLGFFGGTGFFWTPDMVAMNLSFQIHNLVRVYSRIGPFVTGAAALVCILAGTGLVTFALALWAGVDRARRLRDLRREDFKWANLRAALDSPTAIIGIPTLITFVMLCFNKFFDARYTDLFAPPLAIVAGSRLADLWANHRRRILVGVLVAYQGVYAAGMLARYRHDSRKGMNAALPEVWKPKGKLYVSPYVSYSPLNDGYGIGPGEGPWDAEWVAMADQFAAQYLTANGTFTAAGAPPTCREVLYCDGERVREFFQKVYAQNGWDLVYVSKAAAWTPEVKLHHALMTSKWMFTGDVRLFHKRPPAPGPKSPSKGDGASKPRAR